jgi:hypothetical protein
MFKNLWKTGIVTAVVAVTGASIRCRAEAAPNYPIPHCAAELVGDLPEDLKFKLQTVEQFYEPNSKRFWDSFVESTWPYPGHPDFAQPIVEPLKPDLIITPFHKLGSLPDGERWAAIFGVSFVEVRKIHSPSNMVVIREQILGPLLEKAGLDVNPVLQTVLHEDGSAEFLRRYIRGLNYRELRALYRRGKLNWYLWFKIVRSRFAFKKKLNEFIKSDAYLEACKQHGLEPQTRAAEEAIYFEGKWQIVEI